MRTNNKEILFAYMGGIVDNMSAGIKNDTAYVISVLESSIDSEDDTIYWVITDTDCYLHAASKYQLSVVLWNTTDVRYIYSIYKDGGDYYILNETINYIV